jgi:hypothetical protein
MDGLCAFAGNYLSHGLTEPTFYAKVPQYSSTARIKREQSLTDFALARLKCGMDLYYDYIAQDIPAARKKALGLRRNLAFQGLAQIQWFTIKFGLVLMNYLIACNGASNGNLHNASLGYNLSVLIEKFG